MENIILHHFGISVPNLDETIAWYGEKLGFTLDYRYEIASLPARVAFMTWNSFRVEIFEVQSASPMPNTRRDFASDLHVGGLKHVAFGVADIERVMAEMKARGVDFVTEIGVTPASGGERYVFFRDNNGILFELYQPVRP